MAKSKKVFTTERSISDYSVSLVQLIADGFKVSEISKKVKVNRRTLEQHIEKIKIEYAAKNSCNLVAIFLRNKLIK